MPKWVGGEAETKSIHPLVAVVLKGLTGVASVLGGIVLTLNLLGGTVVVVWLAVLGEWAMIGLGILLGLVMPLAYALANLPGMGLAVMTVMFARGRSKARALAVPFGFLGGLYSNALVAIWVIWVFGLAVAAAKGQPHLPYLLWAYTTAMGPLYYMASKEPRENGTLSGTTSALLYAVVCYIICLGWALFGMAFRPWLYAIIAIGTGISLVPPALMLSEMVWAAQPTPEAGTDVVYMLESGTKYHRAGCRYLANGDITISREEAEEWGYSPCSVCMP